MHNTNEKTMRTTSWLIFTFDVIFVYSTVITNDKSVG